MLLISIDDVSIGCGCYRVSSIAYTRLLRHSPRCEKKSRLEMSSVPISGHLASLATTLGSDKTLRTRAVPPPSGDVRHRSRLDCLPIRAARARVRLATRLGRRVARPPRRSIARVRAFLRA